ncbi:Tab2/Atab2 family RNA-binding protein [Merismopedia glauca]|uniref:DUF1092 domain-containing protein n=1 Tax=Merismopedia glauca CCAP 1448/3 TaxID=1296344 RepID=A0A2T1BXZ0_9CYAN|nr:Tab2/Atab2 family RNA-binding protein [Merismopedia glauca]PSB00862.1 hypothetical protein C7B64_21325 [Merismopedia glauca CCAP 1448/3]
MGTIWELDFYSRPILDENQKKVWEVLICESPTNTTESLKSLFRYAEYCPHNQVNSVWLSNAIQTAMQESGTAPQKIRFFRLQMNNMITKACKDMGIPGVPSRRTIALNQWLQHRMTEVYPQHPNYQGNPNPSVQLPPPVPIGLPDALIGEKWAFVTLTVADFQEMPEWDISFGEGFPLETLAPTTPIPGAIVYSSRAMPLAGWMSGIEPASIKFTPAPQSQLLLETGGSDSWILVDRLNSNTQAEAARFEQAKNEAQGIHFLAIQASPKSEDFAGFWLMQAMDLG